MRRHSSNANTRGIISKVTPTPVTRYGSVQAVLAHYKESRYDPRRGGPAGAGSGRGADYPPTHRLTGRRGTFRYNPQHEFINAIATLNSPGARELLLGAVDPVIRGIALPRRPHSEEALVTRLSELAQRRPEVAERLRELCDRDLPETNRHILSKVMGRFGTPEALFANLTLIDDARRSPVPQGVREQLEMAFVERRPYSGDPNAFTLHARAANEIRAGLLRMAHEDRKRRKSAFSLPGQNEVWRLEHGRPTDEPEPVNDIETTAVQIY